MVDAAFVVFDLDNTLADSIAVKALRDRREWSLVRSQVPAIRPFDGVLELWEALRSEGVYLAVVTHSPRWYAQQLLEHFQIEPNRLVAYSDLGGLLKPNPYGYRLATQRCKCKAGIAVGDERHDMEAATALPCVGVFAGWSKNPSLGRGDCRAAGWRYASRPADVLAMIVNLVCDPE